MISNVSFHLNKCTPACIIKLNISCNSVPRKQDTTVIFYSVLLSCLKAVTALYLCRPEVFKHLLILTSSAPDISHQHEICVHFLCQQLTSTALYTGGYIWMVFFCAHYVKSEIHCLPVKLSITQSGWGSQDSEGEIEFHGSIHELYMAECEAHTSLLTK